MERKASLLMAVTVSPLPLRHAVYPAVVACTCCNKQLKFDSVYPPATFGQDRAMLFAASREGWFTTVTLAGHRTFTCSACRDKQ